MSSRKKWKKMVMSKVRLVFSILTLVDRDSTVEFPYLYIPLSSHNAFSLIKWTDFTKRKSLVL